MRQITIKTNPKKNQFEFTFSERTKLDFYNNLTALINNQLGANETFDSSLQITNFSTS